MVGNREKAGKEWHNCFHVQCRASIMGKNPKIPLIGDGLMSWQTLFHHHPTNSTPRKSMAYLRLKYTHHGRTCIGIPLQVICDESPTSCSPGTQWNPAKQKTPCRQHHLT